VTVDPPWLPPARVVPLPGRGEAFARVLDGPPGALPVLLLHGWMATADVNWFSLFPSLAGQHPVVAPDLRGHGRGPSTPFSLEGCADDAAALMHALGHERFVVVGYSLGGAVAQLVTDRHPHRVAGTVLAATALHWRGPLRRWLLWRSGWDGAAQRSTEGRWFAHRLISRAARRSPEVEGIRDWAAGEIERGHPGSLRRAGRALNRFDGRPMAARTSSPTVVVVTTGDTLVRPSRQRDLAARRRAEIVELAANHDAPARETAAFAVALTTAISLVPWDREIRNPGDRDVA
jgi:pimeloyl-ACP methyl ester carboxylesterase